VLSLFGSIRRLAKNALPSCIANTAEIEPILTSQPMHLVNASMSLPPEMPDPFVAHVKRHLPFCQVILLAARFRGDRIMDARARAERRRAAFLPKIMEPAR